MGNLDLEFQVRLGLAGALLLVKLLHEALLNSVKIDADSFKTIFDMLKKAESSADKLSGRLNTAFKTSTGSKSFLKDYEKMIELLSTAQLKLGNLGFQDIKFSIQDLKAVDESVKRMQELETAIDNILNLKAITLVNSSSVDGIEKLREYIASLNTDVSKLSFEKLNTSLNDALNEVNTKITLINGLIANINKTINGLDASNLKNLEAGINATHGVNIKLLDDKSIDAANEKLREFKKEFSGLSDKAYNSLLVNQSTKDISKFIEDETNTIKAEYQKLIEVIRDEKAQIMAAMSSVDATGHFGKTGTLKYYNTQELNDIINSSEMVKEIFDKFDEKTKHAPAAAFARIKVGLKDKIDELNKQEIDLTGLRDKVETSLSKVFDGLSERTVADVKKVKTTIEDNLNQFNIKAADLKAFGFDISSIEKGQSLVTIYNSISTAIDLYKAKLEETRGSLENTDLVQLLALFEQLSAAQQAWLQSQANSGDTIEKLKAEIADLREKLELLALSYNKEMTPKVNNNNLYQAKNAIEDYINSLTKLEGKLKALSNVLMAVTRWMGFYQVLNLTKRAINDMKRHITELDTVMTKIAVVTNMSQDDLWELIGKYSEIARQYGVAIKGVYEVSQIYYQQGLNKGDVMGLTTETLKMARIAGIDYATAADYMTTAIRGFKLEMTEAAHVTDVFSNLAAHTASSTEELATAISKTAASAANVGASFEATSAMMATMIATTRESATNIGTALKSIISRYGEMKANPNGTDLEGEEYSLNKVDAALKSIGVSLLDANHQFRDFDDVIYELAEKWDGIDKSAQRYIATIMAGNRQQSRFLALVSNFEEYKRALELANNSENAGELQTLKTLDSIDAKVERMKVTIQEFYTSSGILDLYKGILDTITNVISAANNLPKAFGKLPVTAIAIGFSIVSTIKNVLTLIITLVQSKLKTISTSFDDIFALAAKKAPGWGKEIGKNISVAILDEVNKTTITVNTSGNPITPSAGGLLGKLRSSGVRTSLYLGSTAASLAGTALTLGAMNKYGAAKTEDEVRAAAGLLIGGAVALTASGALSGIATGAMLGGQSGGIWGAAIGGIIGAISSGWSAIASAIQMSTIDTAKNIELKQKEVTEKEQKATEAKGKVSELLSAYDRLKSLEEKLYESIEAMQEYYQYMNLLADTYPNLVSSMELSGDKIIRVTDLEIELANARSNSASKILEQLEALKELNRQLSGAYGQFLNLMNLTYTGDLKSLNVSQYALLVKTSGLAGAWSNSTRGQLGMVSPGNANSKIIGIENPYEALVKAYDLILNLKGNPLNLNMNGNNYAENDWKLIFELNAEDIIAWVDTLEHLSDGMPVIEFLMRQNLMNSLKSLLEQAKNANIDVDLSEVTRLKELTDINDITKADKYNYDEIIEAVRNAKLWVNDQLEWFDETNKTITKTAFDVEIEDAIRTKTKTLDKNNLTKFTSALIGLRDFIGFDLTKNVSSVDNNKLVDNFVDWADKLVDAAEKLLLLKLNNFSIGNSQTFATALGIDEKDEANKFILDALVAKYEAETDKVRTDFITALLKNVFKTGTDEDGNILFDKDLVSKWTKLTDNKDSTDIPPALLNILLRQLTQYKELKDKGYTIAAENYLSGLENIYKLVGILEEDKIDDASAILRDLDLTDIESIDTAIHAFEGIEGAKEIITELLNLRNKVALDIGITLERILSSASEAISSVEKILDNIGKGMSESDALKQALEIINKSDNRARQARSLINFDSEVGQWMLTPLAIREAYNLTVDASNKEIKDITKILGAFNSDLGSTIASLSDFGDKDLNEDTLKLMLSDLQDKALELKLTSDLANKFIQQVLEWRNDYLNGDTSISWQEYIELQLKSYKELLEGLLTILLQLIKESPLEYLAKVNWENLASGEATDIEKEYLRVILQIAGMTAEQISTIMTEVAKAQYDNLEKILSGLGLNFKVGKTTKKKAGEANALSYVTLFNELSDASINELSETAKAAAEELGYAGISSDLSRWPATVAYLLVRTREKIDEFYNNNLITLEEYNNVLATAAQQVNKDDAKAQAVIDMAKDGISIKELEDYAVSIGDTINDYWDETTNQFKDKELNEVFEYDPTTQSMKPKAEATAALLLAALAKAFNVTLDGFIDDALTTIDALIAQRAKENKGNQIKNQLSKLASAGVGEEVNISLLTSEMKSILGATEKLETIAFASTVERDALLLLLDSVIKSYNGEGKEILQDWYTNTKNAIENKKVSEYSGLTSILSKDVSIDSAKTFLNSIGKDANSMDRDTLIAEMKLRGYDWNEYTQDFKANSSALVLARERLLLAMQDKTISPETLATLRKQVADLEQEFTHDKKRDALANLLSNYQDAELSLSEFYAQFGKGYSKEELKQKGILTTDEHGKEIIDIDKLNEVVEGYDDLFKTVIEEKIDEYISNAEKAGSLFTLGTTSLVEMSAFKEAYKKLTGGDVEFIFDPLLLAWTIDIISLRNYLSKAAATTGLDEEGLKSWIDNLMKTLLTDNLDFSGYLAGTNTKKENDILKKNLTDYFKAHNEDYMPYMGSLEEWAEQRTDSLLASLNKGGQAAVDALKSVKGELTTEEIQNAYRAQVAPIKTLYDQIDELQVGSVVAENQINALIKAGFTVNADGVITAVGNLVEAYKSLYDLMKDTGEATLAELNTAMGKYLDNRDGLLQAIDALSNATNMTFSLLAEIYTAAGLELTEELVDAMEETGIIHSLGGNKLMIKDFKAFASRMGWKAGSEEYINAFKAYNDSLIEYDRQTEKSIVEEIKNVVAAKPGDKINLTHFTSILGDGLNTWLEAEGTVIKDGILTLANDADITDIASQLLTIAAESGRLIPEEIAEIADAINEVLTRIVSLIKEGIAGTLSNVNKISLASWGKNNGLNLLFIQTAEGFKLALSSAIEVYNTLKSIDALQGKLVFDELNKSLQESNEHYKSISDIANRIKTIESIAPDARSKEYAQELALAKEIYAVRSTTEDSSFSFMSNKIPGAQNNPINYFNNWAQAINTFNDALKTLGTYTKGGEIYKSGFVDYDFWYNLVTEMNNIAALGGDIEFAGETLDGSLEAASKLILKGADSLVVTDTGEVKVALNGMSLDFAAGANAFSGNVTEGILALAKSQSKMLDGLIKLLEAVVAMDLLGDIDVGDNGILDLSELFEVKTGEQNWTISLKNLDGFNAFIEKAGDSLDSIIINGLKFTDLAEKAKTEGLDKAMAENFTAIMNSLYQMYKSGDYNLDNLYDSIQLIMAQSKFTGELQLGDTILHVKHGAVIIETEDKKGKKEFQTPNGETYDTIGEAIARSAVMAQGIKDDITYEGEIATGNIEIKTLGTDVKITSDTEGNLTFNGESFDNIDLYIQKLIDDKKLEDTEAAKLKTNVGLEIGTVKLDSFSYKSIDSEIREEFEKKLASGSQIEVDAFIDANPVLKLFKGKTGAEIQEILHLDDVKIIVDNKQAIEGISEVENQLNKLHDKTITVTVNKEFHTSTNTNLSLPLSTNLHSAIDKNAWRTLSESATGNIGIAKARGTLMGELGPELVVSNGRYFVAGQNGAEMVNLADDAIVFNHLQTKSLLEKGMSNGRGKAVTSEKNAIAYATGNINGGPAKASASAALEALKQLKAQWDALAGLSARDLAGKGGGGGGGGGKNDPKAFIKDLEKWYNWLQRIAVLEQKINYEEQLRSKLQSDMIAHGREYAQSQLDTLPYLKEQAAINKSLYESQEAYFEKRRAEMNDASNPFSALYDFDEYGQLKYKDGALAQLSELVGRDSLTGQANYTAAEQYEKLVAMGYGKYMEYDSSGNKIDLKAEDWQVTAVQAFWDKIDADQQEMQSLHDSVEEHKNAMLQAQLLQNEILKAIEDNLIAVEDKVLKAIEDTRQREIDELLKERDAIEESSKNLIDGLSNQLLKERDMYSRQQGDNELTRLQRQLAILLRSGGSASLIANLQSLITDKMQDNYFDAQEALINALLEASDNQLERLDRLIDLMTELLAYEKENGLLWNQVYEVMSGTPELITEFITSHDSQYWGESPTKLTQDTRDVLFEALLFVQFREKVVGGLDTLIAENSDAAVAEESKKITEEANANNTESASIVSTPITESGSGSDSTDKTNKDSYDYYKADSTYHWKKKDKSDKKKHTWDKNGTKCKVCGYLKSLGQAVKDNNVQSGKDALNAGYGPINDKFISTVKTLDAKNNKPILNKIPTSQDLKKVDLLETVKKNKKVLTNDNGGMVEEDGLEFVHKKEGVLTAEQTSILRNDILSNKPNSLLNLLMDFRDAYERIPSASAYDSIGTSTNGIVIENATVEMNVSKIANDYDAQRAGEQALEKMLQIARKTSAQNRIGR